MSPLIYVGTTSSTFKASWKGYLNFSSPVVLQNCQADGKYYTVLLDYSPGKESDSSNNSEISFRVEETSSKWSRSNNKGKVVYKKGNSGNSLESWGLQPQTNTKFDFMYPDPSGATHGSVVRKLKAACEDGLVIESIGGFNNTIELSELNLTLQNTESCQSSFGYTECSITINSSNKLRWKVGSEPKVIWRAI